MTEAYDNKDSIGRFAAYQRLLGIDGVPTLIVAMLLNNFGFALPLAMVLMLSEQTGSLAVAGGAVGAYTLLGGLLTPLRGRAVDRWSVRTVIAMLAVVHFTMLILLLMAASRGAAAVLLIAIAGIAGGTTAPVGPSLRAVWKALLPERQLETAYASQAILNESASVGAPLVAGLLVAVASGRAAVGALATIEAFGALLYASANVLGLASKEAGSGSSRALGSWLFKLISVAAPFGVAIGALDVSVPASAAHWGVAGTAGLGLSAFAAGSLLAGIAYGMRSWESPPSRRLAALFTLSAAGFCLLLAAQGTVTLALALFLAGTPTTAIVAALYKWLDELTPAGAEAEATGWLFTIYAAGSSLGVFVAGIVAQHIGVHAAILVSAAGSAIAALRMMVSRGR